MNWTRIKTILIFALIAINLLLVYTMYQNKKLENNIAIIEKQQIFDLYNEKGIQLPDDILDTKLSMSNIEVKLSSYDLNEMKAVFEGYRNEDIANPVTQIIGNELKYTTRYEVLDDTYLSDDKILDNARDLIADLGFSVDDIYLEEVGKTGKKTILKYSQIVNGSILTDSSMIISFNNNNLIEFKRLWYDIVNVYESDRSLLSPEYALYTFLGLEFDRYPNRKKDISIQSLKLVYRLDQSLDNTLANPVVEGVASIYWEVKTSNDLKPYFIDAIID